MEGYPLTVLQHSAESSMAYSQPWLSDNPLRLSRLAYGKLEMSCPPRCATMGEPLPATADANQQFQFALELALS